MDGISARRRRAKSPLDGWCQIDGQAHHWLVLTTDTRFARPSGRGDLVETSIQRCKKCGYTRENHCVIPPESLSILGY